MIWKGPMARLAKREVHRRYSVIAVDPELNLRDAGPGG
jgi:hypothetical protein